MAENKSKPRDEKCPFWALEENKECGMAKGGMYIPMPEHVRMFCLSSKCYRCSQYIKGCELTFSRDENEVNGFLDSKDRRRLQRYPEQIFLDLIVSDRQSDLKVLNSYKAKSLDVSLGGLRLESYKEFTESTAVSFVMDPDFSSESLLGFGEVRWCKFKKESNKFESGIAFSSFSTSESMRDYLEL